MAMTKPKPINVLFVASASGTLLGGAAVLFAPVLSFVLLSWGAAPSQFKNTMSVANDGMLFAVLAPVFCAAFGFVAGALVAIGHNIFAEGQRKHVALKIKQASHAAEAAASFGNVA